MVAITVILAAVIGTFVLGLGDNIEQNGNAGTSYEVQEETNGYLVDITITSLRNADTVEFQVENNEGDNDPNTDSWTEIGSSNVGDTGTVGTTGGSSDELLERGDKIIARVTTPQGNTNVVRIFTV